MTKKCSKCQEIKSYSEYYILKSGKPHCWCQKCCKIINDERKLYRSQYYQNNKEAILKGCAAYSLARREKDPRKQLFSAARCRAKKKNLPFNIEEADLILPQCCPVLGLELTIHRGRSRDSSPSLDRIIPDLGYIKGNVHIISWRANSIKNDASIEDIDKLISFLKAPFFPDTGFDQNKNAIDCLYFNALTRARELNLPFNIEKRDILIPKTCPIFGNLLVKSVGRGNVSDNSPTLDRINPSLGYVKGNIVVIGYRANRIKSNASIEELQKIKDYLMTYLTKGTPNREFRESKHLDV